MGKWKSRDGKIGGAVVEVRLSFTYQFQITARTQGLEIAELRHQLNPQFPAPDSLRYFLLLLPTNYSNVPM